MSPEGSKLQIAPDLAELARTANKAKPFVIKTTSKSLIRDLKKLQAKHGVFYVCTLNTKEIVSGLPSPADLDLVLIRNKRNELDHAILTDKFGASVITGQIQQLVDNEIMEELKVASPPSEKPLVVEDELVEEIEKDVAAEAMQENETADQWAKRTFPNGMNAEEAPIALPEKGSPENPLGL